jgi:hypothetical protein
MDHPATRPSRSKLPIILLVIVSLLIGLGTFVSIKNRLKTRPIDVLDQTIGVRSIPGIQESGFHQPEIGTAGEPFRWTKGTAKLTIPIGEPLPIAMYIRLGIAIGKQAKLTIQVNGKAICQETIQPHLEWARLFDLQGLISSGPMTIDLISDTFTPSSKTDNRVLGVDLRDLQLISATRNFVDENLGAEPVAGVEESGFHNREKSNGEPCRWTNGKAHLVVPLGVNRKWKSIVVSADIPNRPNYRFQIVVNGTSLCDEVVKPGQFLKELPLEGIEFAGQARIELDTSSIKPEEMKGKDSRTLGVRLFKVKLIEDKLEAKQ